jgi:hypothetical protein
MITEILTCAARVISTVSFVMCVAAQAVAAASTAATRIRELSTAISHIIMNLHKELTKMGIGATTLPSFQFVREAA